MPFSEALKRAVDEYARNDLAGDLDAHIGFFSFLSDDPALQRRVGEEYFSARYIYKLWEGMRIEDDWGRRAQVQLQVQQYASVYEACLHHLLFVRCAGTAEVDDLLSLKTLKHWSVSQELQSALDAAPGPEGRAVVAAIRSTISIPDTKVRFEHKADAAVRLGIIDAALAEELKEFYAARNLIHIHAELQKGSSWTWKMEFATNAYWRLIAFKEQVEAWQDAA